MKIINVNSNEISKHHYNNNSLIDFLDSLRRFETTMFAIMFVLDVIIEF